MTAGQSWTVLASGLIILITTVDLCLRLVAWRQRRKRALKHEHWIESVRLADVFNNGGEEQQ